MEDYEVECTECEWKGMASDLKYIGIDSEYCPDCGAMVKEIEGEENEV